MTTPNKMGKKGQLGEMEGLAKGLATISIVLVIAFLIMAQAKTQIVSTDGVNTANASSGTWSYGYNSTNTTQNAMQGVPQWLPIIVITVIGAALLALVRRFRS